MPVTLVLLSVLATSWAEARATDLFGELTRDVQTRSLAAMSAYERQQGLKVMLGSRNASISPMMIRRDASVEKYIFRDFSRRLGSSDALVSVGPTKSILCVGARLGGEVRAFTRLGALAVGIDFNPGVRNPWALWGDATRIQFADNSFDYLYSNIIDHIEPRPKFFAEARRVLKVGGKLLAYVDQNEPDAFSIHDNRGAGLIKMRDEIKASGLSLEREEKWGGGGKVRPLPQNWGGTVVFVARK
tara:strand:- start:122 stop:853 length:732 start_codon:yes stop_codon:yes gene_type:complete